MLRARPVRSAGEGLKICPHRAQNRWLSAWWIPQFQQSGKVPPGGPLAATSRDVQLCAVRNDLPTTGLQGTASAAGLLTSSCPPRSFPPGGLGQGMPGAC
jgi:hypothetical protein